MSLARPLHSQRGLQAHRPPFSARFPFGFPLPVWRLEDGGASGARLGEIERYRAVFGRISGQKSFLPVVRSEWFRPMRASPASAAKTDANVGRRECMADLDPVARARAIAARLAAAAVPSDALGKRKSRWEVRVALLRPFCGRWSGF